MRVLLVDGDAERASLVAAGLAEAGFDVVAVAPDVRDLTGRVRDEPEHGKKNEANHWGGGAGGRNPPAGRNQNISRAAS